MIKVESKRKKKNVYTLSKLMKTNQHPGQQTQKAHLSFLDQDNLTSILPVRGETGCASLGFFSS